MTAEWYTAETPEGQERLTGVWSGAPVDHEELCTALLEVAAIQVWKFAPESFDAESEGGERLPLPEDAPTRLIYAQLLQAQDLWNQKEASASGEIGSSDYSFTPKSLSKTIRGIIRPPSGAADAF